MRKKTMFEGVFLIADEYDIFVAVEEEGKITYRLYDDVRITGDIRGYICPGITREGYGRIVEICEDDTDHFFGILTEHGEFGFVKKLRIEKIY